MISSIITPDVLNKYYDGYFEIPDQLNYFIKIYEEFQDFFILYIDNRNSPRLLGESNTSASKNIKNSILSGNII